MIQISCTFGLWSTIYKDLWSTELNKKNESDILIWALTFLKMHLLQCHYNILFSSAPHHVTQGLESWLLHRAEEMVLN